MTTYQKADMDIELLAKELLVKSPEHHPIVDHRVRIDFVMAYPEYDDQHQPKGVALKLRGQRCFGQCRVIPLKDRAMGRGDVEIVLDGHWWEHDASETERAAVLDHELTHISVAQNAVGVCKTDDLQRPVIRLRRHDVEVGWFASIARKYGTFSVEVKQAKFVMDNAGQFFWPQLFNQTAPVITEDHIESAVKSLRASGVIPEPAPTAQP